MEASSTISKFFNADTARWFDLLIEGIVILDEKQRFVYANQAYRNHVHMDDETYAKYQGKDRGPARNTGAGGLHFQQSVQHGQADL